MKTFVSLTAQSFKNSLQYRAAALAGMATQVFWGLIMIMVLDAFYAHRSGAAVPISLNQAVSYIWLGQAFLGLLPWSFDKRIQEMIIDGRISYDFIRPKSVYWMWFCRTLGWRTASTVLRAIPLFIFSVFGMKILGMGELALRAPAGAVETGCFAIAMCVAAILGTSIAMLINISMIWTISGVGVTSLVSAIVTLFSGMVIPLPLFPDWSQKVITFLPFRGLVDAPFRLYTGHIPAENIFRVLFHQIIWLIFFTLAGIIFLRKGAKTLVVQGG